MPVTHRGDDDGIYVVGQGVPQPQALPLRQRANRRPPSNLRVLLCDVRRAPRRNPFSDWTPQDSQGSKWNNVRVEKEVQQKRLDGLQRVRPAKLEQYNPDALLPCQLFSPVQGVFQAFNLAAQRRCTPRNRDVKNEKHCPRRHIRRKNAVQIFHAASSSCRIASTSLLIASSL